MKYLLEYHNYNTITDIQDIAWLFFLYDSNGLPVDSWKNDTRINNISPDRTCDTSLIKFSCVDKVDGRYVITDRNEALNIINKRFNLNNNFKQAIKKSKKLKDEGFGYHIHKIPYNLFLIENPQYEKAFDIIKDRIVDHFNSMSCYPRQVEKLMKSRRIKEFNWKEYFEEFPEEPSTFKLYRGLKYKYDKSRDKKYSCWTTDYDQAVRFASHHFNTFSPIYTKEPHILETEVSFDDVLVFVGGEEHEVILRNPVDMKIIQLTPKTT